MAARIYRDKDADLRWLKGKTCAIVGFGSQGRAQALNLRDSHIKIVIGLDPGRRSRARAKTNRLTGVDTDEAGRRSEIIFLARPDTRLPEAFTKDVAPD
jgi:ketol-acid reductoisomerase